MTWVEVSVHDRGGGEEPGIEAMDYRPALACLARVALKEA
jgi:hypothetical protein